MLKEQKEQLGGRKISLHAIIALLAMILIALTAAAIWIPTAILSSEALIQARKDQVISTTIATSNSVLAYFQTASLAAKEFKNLYEISRYQSGDKAHLHYFNKYSEGSWVRFSKQPTLKSLLLYSGIRHPRDIANNSECDSNVFLQSSSYLSIIDSSTTVGSNTTICELQSHKSCQPDSVRVNYLASSSNKNDPLHVMKSSHRVCDSWLGSSKFVWRIQGLPGSHESLNTGITEMEWIDHISVVGSKRKSLFKKVFFPLKGPSWAPNSAFGAVSLQISGNGNSSVTTLPQLLRSIAEASDLNEILYLITRKGELAATSLAEHAVEIVSNEGEVSGIRNANSAASFVDPIVSISDNLIKTYCKQKNKVYSCDWSHIPLHFKTDSDYLIILKVISDPLASNLNVLLVTIVKESLIVNPAKELNVIIACTAASAVLIFAFCAHVVGHSVSKPIRVFTQNITESSTTLSFEEVAIYPQSLIAEVCEMNHALEMLTHKLSYYKSFLPDSAYGNGKQKGDDELSNSELLKSKGSEESAVVKQENQNPLKGSAASLVSVISLHFVTDSIREKNCIVIATNIRDWTTKLLQSGAGSFEFTQCTYIATLSEIAGNEGKIIFVNGDRSLILFPRIVDGGDCSRRLLSIRKRKITSNLVVAMSVGRVFVGLVGTDRFRSNNVAGAVVSQVCKLCENVGKGLYSDQLLAVVTLDVVSRYPMEICPAGVMISNKSNVTKFGILNCMKANAQGWLFDSDNTTFSDEGSVCGAFFKLVDSIIKETADVFEQFEAFRMSCEPMLTCDILDETCQEFIKFITTDVETFEKVALIKL